MRTLCSLLLICCLLFSYDTPVVGFLRRSVSGSHECHSKGGYCYRYYCPRPHRRLGSCYPYAANCCRRRR
ncbi:beta-defensin 11 [Rattus rattus]|uniref:beta-defensin 11 n=1 Tax=Rattus rattus TaxID=10117 RepID=UPI0013F2D0B6|nr:beta-defensin 11 [Rattus rattus]